MARIRTIKPSFWTHPVTGRLSDLDKWMAVALLTHADDEGYFLADQDIVRGAVAPFTEDSVRTHGALTRLAHANWLELRKHQELGLLGRIVNFERHQKINRPTPSKLKSYWELSEDSLSTHGGLTEGSLQDRDRDRDRDQGTGIREQGEEQGKEKVATQPAVAKAPAAAVEGVVVSSKRPRKPVTEQQGLLGDLARDWSERHPALGTPSWGREVVGVNKLAQQHGHDDVLMAWGAYLADDWDGHDGHPLGGFVRQFDRWRARAAKVLDPISRLSPAGQHTARVARQVIAELEEQERRT